MGVTARDHRAARIPPAPTRPACRGHRCQIGHDPGRDPLGTGRYPARSAPRSAVSSCIAVLTLAPQGPGNAGSTLASPEHDQEEFEPRSEIHPDRTGYLSEGSNGDHRGRSCRSGRLRERHDARLRRRRGTQSRGRGSREHGGDPGRSRLFPRPLTSVSDTPSRRCPRRRPIGMRARLGAPAAALRRLINALPPRRLTSPTCARWGCSAARATRCLPFTPGDDRRRCRDGSGPSDLFRRRAPYARFGAADHERGDRSRVSAVVRARHPNFASASPDGHRAETRGWVP